MSNKYSKLTPSMILNIAAPHTWTASIFPVLLAACIAWANGYELSISLVLCLLAISVLLQSSVNAVNDYFDFVKGSDTKDDNLEETDSVLVYNNVNPKHVLAMSIILIVIALLLGMYCIFRSGPFCLLIAAIGIAAIGLYSGGKLPISYLPIGELVSGFVMGGLITYASYSVLTGDLSPWILIASIPLIINIALIMMSNNISDIEKDIESGRRTLPVILGRPRTRILYKCLILASLISILTICLIWFPAGSILFPFLALIALPSASKLFASKLDAPSRISTFAQICTFNIASGSIYCLMVCASMLPLGI